MKSYVYVLVIDDRHTDPEPRVFGSRCTAFQALRAQVAEVMASAGRDLADAEVRIMNVAQMDLSRDEDGSVDGLISWATTYVDGPSYYLWRRQVRR